MSCWTDTVYLATSERALSSTVSHIESDRVREACQQHRVLGASRPHLIEHFHVSNNFLAYSFSIPAKKRARSPVHLRLGQWDSELMATGYEVHAITFDTHIFQFILASLTISYGH